MSTSKVTVFFYKEIYIKDIDEKSICIRNIKSELLDQNLNEKSSLVNSINHPRRSISQKKFIRHLENKNGDDNNDDDYYSMPKRNSMNHINQRIGDEKNSKENRRKNRNFNSAYGRRMSPMVLKSRENDALVSNQNISKLISCISKKIAITITDASNYYKKISKWLNGVDDDISETTSKNSYTIKTPLGSIKAYDLKLQDQNQISIRNEELENYYKKNKKKDKLELILLYHQKINKIIAYLKFFQQKVGRPANYNQNSEIYKNILIVLNEMIDLILRFIKRIKEHIFYINFKMIFQDFFSIINNLLKMITFYEDAIKKVEEMKNFMMIEIKKNYDQIKLNRLKEVEKLSWDVGNDNNFCSLYLIKGKKNLNLDLQYYYYLLNSLLNKKSKPESSNIMVVKGSFSIESILPQELKQTFIEKKLNNKKKPFIERKQSLGPIKPSKGLVPKKVTLK